MDRLDFDVFLAKLTEGKSIDETEFCFADDPEETSRWLGCIAGKDMPYWAGGCDIPAGAVFRTAQELADAPVFGGRSLRQRWDTVRIRSIMGISPDEWAEMFLRT